MVCMKGGGVASGPGGDRGEVLTRLLVSSECSLLREGGIYRRLLSLGTRLMSVLSLFCGKNSGLFYLSKLHHTFRGDLIVN